MKKIRKIIIEIILVISAIFSNTFVVCASDEITLTLDNMHDTTAFDCEEMLPGDTYLKEYQVNISHNEAVTLYFDIDITNIDFNLAKYLYVTILDQNDNTVVNNVRMDNFTEKGIEIAKGIDSCTYKIQVYFDANYGNGISDYDELKEGELPRVDADFSWYVKEEDKGHMVIPNTGVRGIVEKLDDFSFESVLLIVILFVLIFLFVILFKKKSYKSKLERVGILVLLGFLICINTTYALTRAKLDLNNSLFIVNKYNCDIDVNDDNHSTITTTSINELFEPGRSRIVEFKINNNGDIDVYYRFYFDDIEGILMNSIDVGIYSDSLCTNKLYEIASKDFDINHSFDNNLEVLKAGKTKTLYLLFKMTEDAGNEYQGTDSEFNIVVEAIQSKNSGGFN